MRVDLKSLFSIQLKAKDIDRFYFL